MTYYFIRLTGASLPFYFIIRTKQTADMVILSVRQVVGVWFVVIERSFLKRKNRRCYSGGFRNLRNRFTILHTNDNEFRSTV